MAFFFRSLIWKIVGKPVRLAVAVGIPLATMAWHSFAQPRHFAEMMEEFESLRQFRGIPTPNHAGTKIVLNQTTEKGIGTYLYDISTGKKQLLHEIANGQAYEFLGWSPNDQLFICLAGSSLRIYQADPLLLIASLPVNNFVGGGWMSNEAIYYRDRASALFRVSLNEKQWGEQKRFLAAVDPKLAGKRQDYTAFNGNEVAWREGNVFWSAGPDSPEPRKLCQVPAGMDVLSSSYTQGTGKFLLLGQDASGTFLASLAVGTGNLERLSTPRDMKLSQFAWFGNRGGYLCSGGSSDNNKRSLVVQPDASGPQIRMEWPVLWTIASSEKEIYLVGAQGAEPTALWRYRYESRTLDSLLSNSERPFKYARLVEPESFEITNASGDATHYNLFPPAGFSPRKKYPLVICEGPRNYEQLIANSGAFCASVTSAQGGRPLPDDYLAAYDALRVHQNIDQTRICWMGSSKGVASILSILLEKGEPTRNSAIFLNSFALSPGMAGLKVNKLLIDYGDKDLNGKYREILRTFQDDATALGTSVSLVHYPGEGHTLNTVSADNRRKRAIAMFLTNLK